MSATATAHPLHHPRCCGPVTRHHAVKRMFRETQWCEADRKQADLAAASRRRGSSPRCSRWCRRPTRGRGPASAGPPPCPPVNKKTPYESCSGRALQSTGLTRGSATTVSIWVYGTDGISSRSIDIKHGGKDCNETERALRGWPSSPSRRSCRCCSHLALTVSSAPSSDTVNRSTSPMASSS